MAFSISIKAKGVKKASKQLRRYRTTLRTQLPRLLGEIGDEVVGRAREDYLSGPRPRRLGRVSGDLARRTLHRVHGERVEVGSNLPYAPVHEFGATIRAKRGPFLVFKTLDKQWHSVREVRIPARPYLRPAMADSRQDLLSIIRAYANRVRREVFRG